MSNGVPVRLSPHLAGRAREVARIQDRSLTEQVEHWARLGQAVEAVVLNSTVARLKMESYDERLPAVLAEADTAAARERISRSLARKHPVRFGTTSESPNKVTKVESGTRRRGK